MNIRLKRAWLNFFQKEITCTLCTSFLTSFDKTKMFRFLFSWHVYLRCTSFSRPLSLRQTFVFLADFCHLLIRLSSMTPSQQTAAAPLLCIQWWWTFFHMLRQNSKNLFGLLFFKEINCTFVSLALWQTFVIFSPDWAGWHLHSRLLLLLYCAFNNAQHSFTCSYTIQIICLDFYF